MIDPLLYLSLYFSFLLEKALILINHNKICAFSCIVCNPPGGTEKKTVE